VDHYIDADNIEQAQESGTWAFNKDLNNINLEELFPLSNAVSVGDPLVDQVDEDGEIIYPEYGAED